jgi:hypothetical protein
MLKVEITFHERCSPALRYNDWFKAALAYAITWGNSDRVVIHIDKDNNISVSHQKLIPNKVDYMHEHERYEQYFYMQGIYHDLPTQRYTLDQHYSFHS